MPENIRCADCGATVYGLVVEWDDPALIVGDECPNCGGTNFASMSEDEGGPRTDE